jgi:hypothetical protein
LGYPSLFNKGKDALCWKRVLLEHWKRKEQERKRVVINTIKEWVTREDKSRYDGDTTGR